ncbi:carbohydrate ABC transporter permease [Nakamurella sp. PAMC28650]|uniref:carbohydrate ABC transporter permease n=1 Tax=Nakamurella sp. PAMC28650 TaxID=2762325 RepID=UPI00164DF31D|nr:sugar ABC transporter permease [Nakamurella sp. PAMC28650]QNK81966.1 sugar ABC transporter permease [Nakamurella sp. PAMC28650]
MSDLITRPAAEPTSVRPPAAGFKVPIRERWVALAFTLGAVIVLVGLILYPLLDDIRLTFSRLAPGVNTPWVGFRNYKAVFTDAQFWASVGVTAKYTLTALVLEFVIGFGLAMAMARIVRGGGLLRTLILIPTMLTPAVAAINFRNLLNYDSGLINYFVTLFGGHPQAWLASSGYSFAALVLTDVWRSTPFFVLVLSAGLVALSPEVIEAAELDGAGGWSKLRYIQIPMLVPLILVTVLFRVIDLFRTFDTVYTLTNGGPGNATNVVAMQIYNDADVGQYTSYAATEAAVFMLLTLLVSFSLIRVMRSQRT